MTTPTARVAPLRTDEKAAMRRAMRRVRAGCDPAEGVRLAGWLLSAGLVRPGAAVAAYWPMGGEIDPRFALAALLGRGHAVGLPVVAGPGLPLGFGRWHPGATLRAGALGTREPTGPAFDPDVLLVPLLAFDRRGGRLGQGGGFYDRTLAVRRVRAIGCAHACQEVDSVPMGPQDRVLDAIATESGVILVE